MIKKKKQNTEWAVQPNTIVLSSVLINRHLKNKELKKLYKKKNHVLNMFVIDFE